MVRTGATSIKTGGGKSSKGIAVSGGSSSAKISTSRRTSIGGNKLIRRPTPAWQKPITTFFSHVDGIQIEPPSNLEEVPVIEYDSEKENELQAPSWQKPIKDFLSEPNKEDAEPKPTKSSDDCIEIDTEDNESVPGNSKKRKTIFEEKSDNADNEEPQLTEEELEERRKEGAKKMKMQFDFKTFEELEKL